MEGWLYQTLQVTSFSFMESVTGRNFLSYLGSEPKIAFPQAPGLAEWYLPVINSNC